MTPPKIQALFETMRTLVLEKKKKKKRKGTAAEVLKPIQPVSFQTLPEPSATSWQARDIVIGIHVCNSMHTRKSLENWKMKNTLRNKPFQCEHSYHWGRVMSVSTTVPGGGLVGFLPLINNLALILFLTMMTVNLGLKKTWNVDSDQVLTNSQNCLPKIKTCHLENEIGVFEIFCWKAMQYPFFLTDSLGLLTWGMIGPLKRPLSICQ